MTYGFMATNSNGQVLVSSQTRNLHLLQIMTPSSLLYTDSTNTYGGMHQWAYRFTSQRTPVPFFSLTGALTSISAIRMVAPDVWEVTLICEGLSNPPALYVFTDPVGRTSPESYGVKVLMDDNSPAFDSRFNPLSIGFSALIAPASEPLQNGNVSNLTPVIQVIAGTLNVPTPIASYSALAQCERESYRAWETGGADAEILGKKINPWTDYHSERKWAFYRSGIRISPTNQLYCGWICVKHGVYTTFQHNSTSSLPNIVTLGGDGNHSSFGDGGSLPYSNETLNLQPSAVIVANGALYD